MRERILIFTEYNAVAYDIARRCLLPTLTGTEKPKWLNANASIFWTSFKMGIIEPSLPRGC